MATDALRHHPTSANNDLKGVDKSDIVTSDAYKIKDGEALPEALVADSEVSNKPGSSIPSIFGRLIFFRTALKNVKVGARNTGTTPNQVYDQIVSQWLDVMELVFNCSRGLKFEQWNVKEQIKALKDSHHNELADALQKHVEKYFGNQMQNIFLIYYKDELVGGTSPYTFVFTSPNWKSGKPIRSLLQREEKFREFIYKLYLAIDSNQNIMVDVHVPVYSAAGTAPTMKKTDNPAKEIVKGFLEYAERCLDHETNQELKRLITDLKGQYKKANLDEEYEIIKADIEGASKPISVALLQAIGFTKDNKPMDLDAVDLNLYGRPMGQITSDFFIDSDYHKDDKFDAAELPLVLMQGASANLKYYDQERWDINVRVPQIENRDEDPKREMPGCDAYAHNWLTTIDFLDDKLISLPYEMDEDKFAHVINIGGRSYLLPIKPKALKYFTIDHLKDMIEVRDAKGNVLMEDGELVVRLNVPIRNNERSKVNVLPLTKRYNLEKDVVTSWEIGIEERPISVGISPLVRIPKLSNAQDNNVYTVMLQYPSGSDCEVSLAFYAGGSDDPVGKEYIVEKKREYTTVAKFYRIHHFSFDAIEMNLSKDGCDVYGMIIPNFKSLSAGTDTYVYSIDFGTTNTHIAYIGSQQKTATSFSAPEIKEQVEYLSKSPKPEDVVIHGGNLGQMMNKIYGPQSLETLMDQAREFFPNFVGKDYSFPIRTVAYQELESISADGLFGQLSIGFRYPKEIINNPNYYTNLKWDLNSFSDPNADNRAKLFFEELLGMIRTHWITRGNVNFNIPPKIVLTFPLAMGGNKGRMLRLWYNTYNEVFGQQYQPATFIKELAESLAPALSLINAGNLSISGILNVDIGGGTTDIQYYREEGAKKVARYNSVLFAGDDLWGSGYENLPHPSGWAVTDSIFTRFADDKMKGNGKKIKLGFDEMPYDLIQLKGKEKINLLLRDDNNQFSNMINGENGGANDARKVVMLHYAALMYHVVNWIKSDPAMSQQFPAVINFTGYGSKYIESIFGQGMNQQLQLYTEKLLKAFGVEKLPSNFAVVFSNNPKAVTAEGAAIFGSNNGSNLPQRPVVHYGYAESDPNKVVKYNQIEGLREKVYDYFLKFLEGFKSVEDPQLIIPQMTDSQEAAFKEAAMLSFRQTASNLHNEKDTQGTNPVTDSMFFWMLKGSLYKFDEY